MACKKAFFTRNRAQSRDKSFYLLKYSTFIKIFTANYMSNELQQEGLH